MIYGINETEENVQKKSFYEDISPSLRPSLKC